MWLLCSSRAQVLTGRPPESPSLCHFLPSSPLLSDSCPSDIESISQCLSRILLTCPTSLISTQAVNRGPSQVLLFKSSRCCYVLGSSTHWYFPGMIIKIPYARNLLILTFIGLGREHLEKAVMKNAVLYLGLWAPGGKTFCELKFFQRELGKE